MFLFSIKSLLKSLAYMAIIFFVTLIIVAIGDGFGAQYSVIGLIILSCICMSLLSIGMFFLNYIFYDDTKTAERSKRKKGKADNMPWEFYQKLQKRKPVKARTLYICIFLLHWIIAIACVSVLVIYYSEMDSILNLLNIKAQAREDSPAGMLIIVTLLMGGIIVQIFYPLSMIKPIKNVTCPRCGCVYSGSELYDYDFREHSGTWNTTETHDVQVGTLRAGDRSIDVYEQQTVRYKQDYTSRSHKTKCGCIYCGYEYDRRKSSIEEGEKVRY